jgi:ELWxxDGT repeat protein
VGEFEGRSTRTLATPSHLFFTAGDDGEDLWVTDGSPAGTIRVADFAPQLCAARAFFPAEDGAPGWELWESDGTFEGTRRVTDLAPGAFSSMPQIPSLAVANGFLFFSADDGKTGLEPWALPLAP